MVEADTSRCGAVLFSIPDNTGTTKRIPEGSAPPLEDVGDGALGLPAVLLLAQRVPLVVGLLARGQGDLDLGPSVTEVQRQRNDGASLALDLQRDLVQFVAVQEQLA